MRALLVALLVSPAIAQSGPPVHHHIDKEEWALLASDAGVRALDVYSTHKMLENGYHELLLPNAIAQRPAAMAAVEAADVLTVAWIAHRLAPHHRKLAHALTAVDVCVDAPWAVHNLWLTRHERVVLTPRLPTNPLQ